MADLSNVVWENTVDDGAWKVEVVRTGDYTGVLTVVRAADDLEILREDVGLSYRAIFGPDVDDVAAWQARCIEVIDAHDDNPH